MGLQQLRNIRCVFEQTTLCVVCFLHNSYNPQQYVNNLLPFRNGIDTGLNCYCSWSVTYLIGWQQLRNMRYMCGNCCIMCFDERRIFTKKTQNNFSYAKRLRSAYFPLQRNSAEPE